MWVTGNKPHPTSWSLQQFLIYNCCCRAEKPFQWFAWYWLSLRVFWALTNDPCNIFQVSTYCEMYFCNLHISIIFYWPGVHLTDAKKHQILLLCIGRHWWIYCLMIFNVYQTFSSLLTINLIKKGFIWGFVVACYPKEMVKWWCDNLKKVVK